MTTFLQNVFSEAIQDLKLTGTIPEDKDAEIRFDRPRQKTHGDLSTNVALALAKSVGRNPRELAQLIIDALPATDSVEKVELAGPGFINIFLKPASHFEVLKAVRESGPAFGNSDSGQGESVLVEFVSANPTGPLHVGHGRGAAYGDSLARVMRKAGYLVTTEYYINDAGRQMDILAVSVWLRYLELCGEEFDFPDNCYKGDYIWDIAATVHREDGDLYGCSAPEVFSESTSEDPEQGLDKLTAAFRSKVGEEGFGRFLGATLDALVNDIRNDLSEFRVEFDRWYSERSLYDSGTVEQTVMELRLTDHIYEKEGALWFRATGFGDEKDRVVVRENGVPTYFASDIAYHHEKFERGFSKLVDIWGADHHGYIARVKGALNALNHDPDEFIVALVQFATLYRGGEKISMSTRGGDFVTLRELRHEVGTDAARFFYAQRKPDQHLDFDLDLAKSQSNDNPVYYVQYAHARVCSVFRQAAERDIDTGDLGSADMNLLIEESEKDLASQLSRFPEVIATSARKMEPHHIVYYLREVANRLHAYYNAHNVLGAAQDLRTARLLLLDATRQVVANGLEVLGVSAPERM